MGSAYKNKGVQLAARRRDRATCRARSTSRTPRSTSSNDEAPIALVDRLRRSRSSRSPSSSRTAATASSPTCASTRARSRKGTTIVNRRTGKRHKVGRLVRMHADEMEDIERRRRRRHRRALRHRLRLGRHLHRRHDRGRDDLDARARRRSSRSRSRPKDNKAQDNLSKALGRFTREDPTFRAGVDPESGETIISGMGELHLDVYVERMKREYNVEVETGAPQVAYRETITQRAEFNYTHKKQTGGSGQYAKVGGYVEPLAEGEGDGFEFVNEVRGGAIPTEFIPSVEKGFAQLLDKGRLIGFPVIGVRVVVNDGQAHAVDSSDMAFQEAARGAFREVYPRGQADHPRADHEARGRGPGRVPGRGAEDDHAAPRHRDRHDRGGRASAASRPRCRSPRCSATRPTCAPRPRARPSSPWSSRATPCAGRGHREAAREVQGQAEGRGMSAACTGSS